jgi:hypothetical protein
MGKISIKDKEFELSDKDEAFILIFQELIREIRNIKNV